MNISTHYRIILRTGAGALLILFGLICLGVVLVGLAQDLPIWVFGRRAQAEVLDVWLERTSVREEGEVSFQYLLHYRFRTQGGKTFTKVSRIGVNEWSRLEEGDEIAVAYFPLFPAHNRLDDRRFVPLYACAYLPVAALGWMGLAFGWRRVQPMLARLGRHRAP